MKASELIMELAMMMAKYGDVEVVTSEWGGEKALPVKSTFHLDTTSWGAPTNAIYISTSERDEEE